MPAFERRTVVLAPGEDLALAGGDWEDALVVVEAGRLQLESCSGVACLVDTGAVLWMAGLPVVRLRNVGPASLVLVAVSRRRQDLPG